MSLTPFFVAFHSSHAPSAGLSPSCSLGISAPCQRGRHRPREVKVVAKVTQHERSRAVLEISSCSCKSTDYLYTRLRPQSIWGKFLEELHRALKNGRALAMQRERNRKTIISLRNMNISEVPQPQQSCLKKQWLRMQVLESIRPHIWKQPILLFNVTLGTPQFPRL